MNDKIYLGFFSLMYAKHILSESSLLYIYLFYTTLNEEIVLKDYFFLLQYIHSSGSSSSAIGRRFGCWKDQLQRIPTKMGCHKTQGRGRQGERKSVKFLL